MSQTHDNNGRDSQSRAVAQQSPGTKSASNAAPQSVDNRPEAIQLEKLQMMVDNSPQAANAARLQAMADGSLNPVAQQTLLERSPARPSQRQGLTQDMTTERQFAVQSRLKETANSYPRVQLAPPTKESLNDRLQSNPQNIPIQTKARRYARQQSSSASPLQLKLEEPDLGKFIRWLETPEAQTMTFDKGTVIDEADSLEQAIDMAFQSHAQGEKEKKLRSKKQDLEEMEKGRIKLGQEPEDPKPTLLAIDGLQDEIAALESQAADLSETKSDQFRKGMLRRQAKVKEKSIARLNQKLAEAERRKEEQGQELEKLEIQLQELSHQIRMISAEVDAPPGEALVPATASLAEMLFEDYPHEECDYIILGNSPVMLSAYVEARSIPANFIDLPLGGLTRGDSPYKTPEEYRANWDTRFAQPITNYFDALLLPHIEHSNLVVVDYAQSGGSVVIVADFITEYLRVRGRDSLNVATFTFAKSPPTVERSAVMRSGYDYVIAYPTAEVTRLFTELVDNKMYKEGMHFIRYASVHINDLLTKKGDPSELLIEYRAFYARLVEMIRSNLK